MEYSSASGWGDWRCAASRSMLMKGVMPMPPAISTPARSTFLCSVSEPNGPSISSTAPIGRLPSAFLKVLSRMRVVTTSSVSCGALTMENAWRPSPVLRASPALGRITSIAWPARKLKPAGFSR